MWNIKPEQMRLLEQAQVKRFAGVLTMHIESFAPTQFRLMGAAAVHQNVELGIKNAGKYGFTTRGPVRFYVEAMFMLGSFFDTDPQYKNIVEPLYEKDGSDQLDRADRLHEKIMDYVDRTLGDQNQLERWALDKAVSTRFENLAGFAQRPMSDVVKVFHFIYPQKVAFLQEAPIAALVERAYALAAARDTSWTTSGPLFAVLMFTFGHGCLADLQFPWISETLEKTGTMGAPAAAELLFRKFSAYLRQARSNLGGI